MAPPLADEAAALLARKALENGGSIVFSSGSPIAAYAGAAFRVQSGGRARAAGLSKRPLQQLCQGLTRFSELRREAASGLIPLLESAVDARRLQELAPATLRLGNGRQTKVHYSRIAGAPWIASRLQDFFGMAGDASRMGLARAHRWSSTCLRRTTATYSDDRPARLLGAAVSAGAARADASLPTPRVAGNLHICESPGAVRYHKKKN